MVATAGRRVMPCKGEVTLMAAAEGTMAVDERSGATVDGMDKR